MIERSVVIVLGAGASKPYGFPLGRELRDWAISSDRQIRKALERFEFPSGHIDKFVSALRMSGCTSVDEFVEGRGEFIGVGKAMMACLLVRCEIHSSLYASDIDGDWYQYLANMMLSDGFDSFSKNTLSVITYNYDRSLEYYLFNALKYRSGKSDRECADMLKTIPIIHLHGQLGDLPELNTQGNGRQYQTKTDITELRLAAKGIYVVNEPIGNNPVFQRAHEVLDAAEHVVFLGFGYLPINVKRLEFDSHRKPETRYFGTGFELTDSERRMKVQPLFPGPPRNDKRIEIAFGTYNVHDFLRNNLHLFMPWR